MNYSVSIAFPDKPEPSFERPMTETILANEPMLRLAVFLGVLAAMAGWESRRTAQAAGHSARAALDQQSRAGRGRYRHPAADLSDPRGRPCAHGRRARLGAVQLLDAAALAGLSCCRCCCSIWRSICSMCCSTRCPALWRLHRMHHADLEFDVTTGLRFHPVEIVLSMAIKLAVVVALGAPAAGGSALRGAAERHRAVQPRQHPPAGRARPGAALGRRDA